MCGIAGIFGRHGVENGEAAMKVMVGALRHRGPDGDATWSDHTEISLGHARLSIIDLSELGTQPMHSADGRFVLTYNGEIYNYQTLRRELIQQGVAFRGDSDSEVLLEFLARHGVATTLERVHGMFAFALWDRKDRRLILARDRFGEKPLYYGRAGNQLIFASELKPLREHPDFNLAIDQTALASFLKHDYVPTPLCILSGFFKLQAGHYLTGTAIDDFGPESATAYWSVDTITPVLPSESNLEDAISASVQRQMVSDVPIGGFLSGGVDSSLITALMQQHSARPVDTFTIGFQEKDYDESRYAKAIAKHLKTNHHEWVLGEKDVLDVVPSLATVYDEPFADPSQLPTVLLAQKTRQSVTVCLSGDGGDELFGGYNRYTHGPALARRLARLPVSVRRVALQAFQMVSLTKWVHLSEKLGRLSPLKARNIGDKLQKLSNVASSRDQRDLYDRLLSTWSNPTQLLSSGAGFSYDYHFDESLSFTENMMRHDAANYLVDDVMVKVDRAAMSCGLEVRAPLLDHGVYNLAWNLPIEDKVVPTASKKPLREILYRHVPRSLIERPKAGFAVPIEHWLRAELKDWADAQLDPKRLQSQDLFDSGVVRQAWDDHQSGKANNQYKLWNIIVFQQWFDNWMSH